MESVDAESKPEFELVKELSHDVWIAVRRGDPGGQQFLARRLHYFDPIYQNPTSEAGKSETGYLKQIMYEHQQAAVLSRILNHENLISLVGHIQRTPFVGSDDKDSTVAEDFLVWDYCDATNLSALFQDNPLKSRAYYLPESLCWHVLRSLLRAVTYLHDGKRMFCDSCKPSVRDPQFVEEGKDWQPILHRDIRAGNIFFQHPRGKETYGFCKLGNFKNATVTGHLVRRQQGDMGPSGSMAMSVNRGWAPLREAQNRVECEPSKYEVKDRAFLLSDELWSIGSIIFTMMTGHNLRLQCQKCDGCHITGCWAMPVQRCCIMDEARITGCECLHAGCEHLADEPCEHERSDWTDNPDQNPKQRYCPERNINVDIGLARSRYSLMLCDVVQRLLRFTPKQIQMNLSGRPILASPEALYAETMYHKWREAFEESKAYVDVGPSTKEKEKLREAKKVQEEMEAKMREMVSDLV